MLVQTLRQSRILGAKESLRTRLYAMENMCQLLQVFMPYSHHSLGNHEASKTIWIDAICIDQGDPNERAQQVRLMKDIFSRASLTLVWLGEPDEPSLVPSMIQLGQKIIDMTKRVTPRRLASEDFEKCGLPPIDDVAWKALANLFCLPWF